MLVGKAHASFKIWLCLVSMLDFWSASVQLRLGTHRRRVPFDESKWQRRSAVSKPSWWDKSNKPSRGTNNNLKPRPVGASGYERMVDPCIHVSWFFLSSYTKFTKNWSRLPTISYSLSINRNIYIYVNINYIVFAQEWRHDILDRYWPLRSEKDTILTTGNAK